MLSIETEVLRTCRRAALRANSLSQPLSCCAALRVQAAATSTSTSPVDHRLTSLTGGSKVVELARLHEKFHHIKVMPGFHHSVISVAGLPLPFFRSVAVEGENGTAGNVFSYT